jgi:hypothetical protein
MPEQSTKSTAIWAIQRIGRWITKQFLGSESKEKILSLWPMPFTGYPAFDVAQPCMKRTLWPVDNFVKNFFLG